MAEQFTSLSETLIDFIGQQHLFFVGTAASTGKVNVSPKGMDSLRILSPRRVVWLNLTGSGNESAAHVQASPRMTLMFCSFDQQPLILRLYGEAEVVHPRDAGWSDLIGLFPEYTGTRQLFDLQIQLVQTSCGYAVPFYDYAGERPTLTKWSEKKGREGIVRYWQDTNRTSLDGLPTNI